jgi:hypothetical protein
MDKLPAGVVFGTVYDFPDELYRRAHRKFLESGDDVTKFLDKEIQGADEDSFWAIDPSNYACYRNICIGLALSRISKEKGKRAECRESMSELKNKYSPEHDASENAQILATYLDFTYCSVSPAFVPKYLAMRSRGALSQKQKRSPPGFHAVPLSEVLKIVPIWDLEREDAFMSVSPLQDFFRFLNTMDRETWFADEIALSLLEIATKDGFLLLPYNDGSPHIDRVIDYYCDLAFDRTPDALECDWNPVGIVDEIFYGMILRAAKTFHFSRLVADARHAISYRATYTELDPGQLNLPVLADRYTIDCMKAIIKERDFEEMFRLFSGNSIGVNPFSRAMLYRMCDWRDMQWLLLREEDAGKPLIEREYRELAITFMLICIFSFDAADILRQLGPVVLSALFSSDCGWVQLLWRMYPSYCASVGVSNPGPFEVEAVIVLRSGPPKRCVEYVKESCPALLRMSE